MSIEKHYRMKDLAKIAGIGLSTIWRWSKDDLDFPELIQISEGITVVRESDWLEYMKKKATNKKRVGKRAPIQQATGGPALPTSVHNTQEFEPNGISMRDYFAAKAMQADIASPNDGASKNVQVCAKWAYSVADAMLEARK